jgi:hypothetical protein
MNHVPNAPFGTSETCPQAIAAPLTNPAVSLYLNYLVLDSSYLLLDHRAASKAFPHLSAAAAAYASSTNPKLRQVYLRYVGPR